MDKGDIGDAAAATAAVGCMGLQTIFGCLVQIGAAAIGLFVVMWMWNSCIG